MNHVKSTALAAHLNCTRETISDYVAKGVIVKLTDGKFDQDDCRNRAFDYLRAKAAGRTGAGADASLSSERAALTREQTLAAQIKNATARGEVVSLGDIQRHLVGLFSVLRERLLTIPGKLADPLSMRTREEIEPVLRAELHEALDELHDPTSIGIAIDRENDQNSAESSKATA